VSLCLAITSQLNVLDQHNQAAAPAAASNQSVASESLEGLGRAVEHYISKDYALGAEMNQGDRPGLIVQADVGVPHRHADVTVASQLTGFGEGCTVS